MIPEKFTKMYPDYPISKEKEFNRSKVIWSAGDGTSKYDAILLHPDWGKVFWGAFYGVFEETPYTYAEDAFYANDL